MDYSSTFMKALFTLAFALVTFSACGQSISMAPTSVQLWGVTPHIASVSMEYREVAVHFMFPYETSTDKFGDETRSALALSWKPLVIEDIFKAGGIVFHRSFPTQNAPRFNFLLDIGYDFNAFRISYQHISNLGIGNFNPGMDLLKLSFFL